MGNVISDKNFKKVINYKLDNKTPHSGYNIAKDWIVKNATSNVIAVFKKVNNGLNIDATFNDKLDYIYIRQIIPDIKKYSKKKGKVIINITDNSKSGFLYDVYIYIYTS